MRRILAMTAVGLLLTACEPVFTTVGSWKELASAPASLSGSMVTALPDGRALVLGGFQVNTGQPLGQTLLFDPKTNRWSQGASLPEARSGDAVVLLANGMVLVTGGMGAGQGQTSSAPLASTWLYDPRQDSWRRVGDLPIGLVGPSVVRITDGRVLLVGGSVLRQQPLKAANGETDQYQDVATTEIFNPATDRWSAVGSLNTVRSSMTLVALPHDMALAAGGCASNLRQVNPPAINSVELFDPSTGRWTATTPLPSARCGGNGVLLADSRALVVGGFTTGPNGLAPMQDATIFDPRTRSWTAAGATAGAGSISGATPVLLGDGTVFLPADQPGPVQGRLTTTLVGGQIFVPRANTWRFVTTDSVVAASRFGQPSPPVGIALPSAGALIMLNVATLAFDPEGGPPPGQALDNAALSVLLAGVAAALGLGLLIGYLLQRKSPTSHG